ncbi:unnamed protein product [Brassica oleracea]|uniref:(rape) hypothetical protein n=1 Tax=Brassica napus TaxID=3708 RepID=A0A816MTK1_BRANA|nr:unnamed protein product [Brassica napus]
MVSRGVFFSVLAVISGGGDLAGAIEPLRLRNHLSRDFCGEEVLEWLASGEFWRYGQGLGGELHAAAALFAGGPVVCGLHPFCIFAGLGPFH